MNNKKNPSWYIGYKFKNEDGKDEFKIEMYFDAEHPFFLLRNVNDDTVVCDDAGYIISLIEDF